MISFESPNVKPAANKNTGSWLLNVHRRAYVTVCRILTGIYLVGVLIVLRVKSLVLTGD